MKRNPPASSWMPMQRILAVVATLFIVAVFMKPASGWQLFPDAILTSISPNTAQAISSSIPMQANGNNFMTDASVLWTFNGQTTALQSQFQSASLLQATIPATLLTSPGTAQVSVANPGRSPSSSLPFTITVPISLTGFSSTSVPTQAAGAGLMLNSALSVPLTGSVSLSFVPNATAVNSGYRDPALQFAMGGTAVPFTIPAGMTSVSLPAIQQGTVAGTIIATVTNLVTFGTNLLPSSAPTGSVIVPRLPPVVVPNTVRITGRSGSGFNVEFDAYSTPRDLTNAAFTFHPASGAQLQGGPFVVSVSSLAPSWFSGQTGLDNGSRFHLTVPFTYSGDVEALGSVSVTLTNSEGTSAEATGS
jgi:hypothetical protein